MPGDEGLHPAVEEGPDFRRRAAMTHGIDEDDGLELREVERVGRPVEAMNLRRDAKGAEFRVETFRDMRGRERAFGLGGDALDFLQVELPARGPAFDVEDERLHGIR